MAVHAVVNEAGSAGKTTTAVTLAAILAESGRRTLLWDNDAQGNATLFVGVQAVPGKTAAEVLVGERSLDEVIVPTIVDRLFVVPADRSLNGALIQLTRDFGGEQRIRVALETVAGQYDAVIIDCPGAASVLTIAALVASRSVLAVATPSLKELEGLPNLEETIAKVRGMYKPDLFLGAVIPCIVPPVSAGALYVDGQERLREAYGDLVTPPVRRSVRVPEAYSQRVPLTVHAPLEQITSDYQSVADYLVGKKVLP
jgi:chromosome partitioning protein